MTNNNNNYDDFFANVDKAVNAHTKAINEKIHNEEAHKQDISCPKIISDQKIIEDIDDILHTAYHLKLEKYSTEKLKQLLILTKLVISDGDLLDTYFNLPHNITIAYVMSLPSNTTQIIVKCEIVEDTQKNIYIHLLANDTLILKIIKTKTEDYYTALY